MINRSKVNIIIAVLFLSGSAFSLDIAIPVFKIDQSKAWAHGLTIAVKKIDDFSHFSINVEEKLICSVGSVEFFVESVDGSSIGNKAQFKFGYYVTSIKLSRGDLASFIINCKSPSKYSGFWKYEIQAWPQNP